MDFTRFEASLLDPAVGTFKGWTLPNERRFNEWYAREVYEGRGAIVDLGCMNGSSTGALASGLAANGRVAGRKVQAFDRFIKTWPRIPGEPLEDIPTGGDFFHRFLEHTAPWKDLIEPYRGDAGTIAWSEGPIEYLLVDLMKSWDTASMVTERFFPLVLDRVGLVVHQDFLHFYTPWIHVIMHRLRDALEPAFEIPDSCSMVFRKVRPLGVDECRRAADFSSIDVDEVDEAFDRSAGLITRNSKGPIWAAKATYFAHWARRAGSESDMDPEFCRWMERAIEEFRRIAPEFRSEREVGKVADFLSPYMEGGATPVVGPLDRRAKPRWRLLAREGAEATLEVLPDGSRRVDIKKLSGGPAWHVQLVTPPTPVRAGERCSVSFRARSTSPRRMTVLAMEGQPPWAPIGLARELDLSEEMRGFREEFTATKDDPKARLRFNLGASDASVELADVEFVPR